MTRDPIVVRLRGAGCICRAQLDLTTGKASLKPCPYHSTQYRVFKAYREEQKCQKG